MSSLSALIQARLQADLQAVAVDVTDDSAAHAGHEGARAGGAHVSVVVVSAAFAGKSSVQRHRLVYGALKDLLQHEIHALAIVAKTPAEAA